MNPNQKIALLREQIEECQFDRHHLEQRVREAEKQIALLLLAVLVQTLALTAAVYVTL